MSALHLTRAQIVLGRPPSHERGVTLEYLVHQAVADLLGDRNDRGYLWRELVRRPNGTEVLLLSSSVPDIEAGRRMPSHRRVTSLVSKPFRPDLGPGQRVDFEIRVNATRIVTMVNRASQTADISLRSEDADVHKRRVDLWDHAFAMDFGGETCMPDTYAKWLRSQVADFAELGEVAVTERRKLSVRRSMKHREIPIVVANLVGDLTVRDPTGLVAQMASGIGRARAFGCGLLCLAPLGTRPRRPRMQSDVR